MRANYDISFESVHLAGSAAGTGAAAGAGSAGLSTGAASTGTTSNSQSPFTGATLAITDQQAQWQGHW